MRAVVDPKQKQIPIVCPGHTRPLAELQFCRADNRTFLVSACHDRHPMLRDGVTGDWIGTFVGHKGAVWSCRLDRTASLAATASGDFSVTVWDAITGKALWNLPHQHIVKTCDFSPGRSQMLATAGHEGVLRIYNLTTCCESGASNSPPAPVEIPMDANKKVVIGKLNWLNDHVLLTGCADGFVRFWDVESKQLMRTLKVDAEIRDMEISSDDTNSKILTVAAGKKVSFFDLETFQLLQSHTMPIHFQNEGGASLHPKRTHFIAGGSDLWVRVFDYKTGKELECCKGHHGPIRCLRYAPDGTQFASGSEDGTIRLWQDTVAA